MLLGMMVFMLLGCLVSKPQDSIVNCNVEAKRKKGEECMIWLSCGEYTHIKIDSCAIYPMVHRGDLLPMRQSDINKLLNSL